MKYLSLMDSAFLRMESKRTPMHVGAMMTFTLPDDAPPDFVYQLSQQMRLAPFMPHPFECRLAQGGLAKLRPAWEPTTIDMDYHLRLSALAYPGGERELGQLVARLHSHPLDLSRPLWECHLIGGLEPNAGSHSSGRRFALYFKAHHCAIDGMGAMRMVQTWLSSDPSDRRGLGPWMLAAKPDAAPLPAQSTAALLRAQARGIKALVQSLIKMMRGEDSGSRMVLGLPRSLFNRRVSQQRRLGTQILSLPRIKAIAQVAQVTGNDVLLAVIGGAIRRYLVEQNALPGKDLMASVPMAITHRNGQPGNAAAGFVAPLGTNLDDPMARLAWIHRVTQRSKEDLQAMSSEAQMHFALLGITPLLLGQMSGTLPKIPPLFNVVVSNVVLSKNPFYWMGAQLEAMYPVSFLFDGYALNITLVGYNNQVAVGFLGCREAVPHLQRLAVYTSEALTELEAAAGIAPVAAQIKTAIKKPVKKILKTPRKRG